MGNITLSGNLSSYTAGADLTRAGGNTATVSGSVTVVSGTSAVIDQDLLATQLIVAGGATVGTKASLQIGNYDASGLTTGKGYLFKATGGQYTWGPQTQAAYPPAALQTSKSTTQ